MQASAGAGRDLAKESIHIPGIHAGKLRLLDWRTAKSDIPAVPDCLGRPISACTVAHGTGKRVLLMGDSTARMWLPALAEIAKRNSLTLAVASYKACAWMRHPENSLRSSFKCPEYQADWYERVVPEFNPDVVFLAERAFDAPGNPFLVVVRGRNVPVSGRVGQRVMDRASAISLRLLRRPGRQLVIMEPTPLPVDPAFDPLSCVSTGSAHCRFLVSPLATPLVRYNRGLARTAGVKTLDLSRLACPRLPVCDPVVDDIIVRRDHTHLTGTYVLALTDSLQAILLRQRILGVEP